MAEAAPKVTVKLKLPNGDLDKETNLDLAHPTQQHEHGEETKAEIEENQTTEVEVEKESGEGEVAGPVALAPDQDQGVGQQSESETQSDDEEARVLTHMSTAYLRGGRGRGGRGGRIMGASSGRKKIEKKRKPPPPVVEKKISRRDLLPGEVVWAKIPSYPWWPAQVLTPLEEHQRLRHKKSDIFVVFFGDQSQCSWLKRDKVEPWACAEYNERIGKQNKGLQHAIQEALVAINQDEDRTEPEPVVEPVVEPEPEPVVEPPKA